MLFCLNKSIDRWIIRIERHVFGGVTISVFALYLSGFRSFSIKGFRVFSIFLFFWNPKFLKFLLDISDVIGTVYHLFKDSRKFYCTVKRFLHLLLYFWLFRISKFCGCPYKLIVLRILRLSWVCAGGLLYREKDFDFAYIIHNKIQKRAVNTKKDQNKSLMYSELWKRET